ncbi:hypothetical protein NDU88_000417 [Pleurodeles waltl]|uniref:Uncharacterized protein n=1 Tax=Pleurodeles waltl TaxID=8319 RepID=A0AAV7S9J5_PLEWA|nr:hypothetical protein NDU88_000417 [Pleurodeles waltl]
MRPGAGSAPRGRQSTLQTPASPTCRDRWLLVPPALSGSSQQGPVSKTFSTLDIPGSVHGTEVRLKQAAKREPKVM